MLIAEFFENCEGFLETLLDWCRGFPTEFTELFRVEKSFCSSGITFTLGFIWDIDRVLGTISGNVLTPTAFGNGTLSARSWDGKTDSVAIHIYGDPEWVKLTEVPVGMDIGDTAALKAQVKAGAIFTDDLALHFITYSSSDETMATVSAQGDTLSLSSN